MFLTGLIVAMHERKHEIMNTRIQSKKQNMQTVDARKTSLAKLATSRSVIGPVR